MEPLSINSQLVIWIVIDVFACIQYVYVNVCSFRGAVMDEHDANKKWLALMETQKQSWSQVKSSFYFINHYFGIHWIFKCW